MTYDSIKSMRLSKPTDDNHYMFGQLIIFNTMERFAKEDKRNLIIEHGKIIWNSILSDDLKSTVDSNLEQYLSRFLMITFPNLKRYTNTYWCAFPALNFPSRCFQYGHTADELESHFTDSQVSINRHLCFLKLKYFILVAYNFIRILSFTTIRSTLLCYHS